uniref:ROT3 n=1 Tax=Arundo donax TaxID=35708 RepID=A0A0A9BCK0_ARUDO
MQVITETLRLGNIINGTMRTAVRDVVVRGHTSPRAGASSSTSAPSTTIPTPSTPGGGRRERR